MPIFRHEYVFIILNGLPDTTEWNLCVKFTKEHDNPPIRGNPRKVIDALLETEKELLHKKA